MIKKNLDPPYIIKSCRAEFKMLPFLASLVILTTTTMNRHHVNCENILIFMPLPARSHFKSFQPLFEELVKQGHNLTLVSGHSLSDNCQGKYEHININHLFPKLGKYLGISKNTKQVHMVDTIQLPNRYL